MNVLAGTLSIGVGTIYLSLGVLTALDLTRYRSWFGWAFLGATLTCGPHHVLHGFHQVGGAAATPLETLSVALGLPFAIAFIALRGAHATSRPGDVVLPGRTGPVVLTGFVVTAIATALVVGATQQRTTLEPLRFVPGAVQAVAYAAVAWYLLQSQWSRRDSQGTWSLSGLSLVGIFATCAASHLVYGIVPVEDDWHTRLVNLAGIPAAVFFLATAIVLSRAARLEWARRPATLRARHQSTAPWRSTAATG